MNQFELRAAFNQGYAINTNGVLVNRKGKCLILPTDRHRNSLLNIWYVLNGYRLHATIKIQDFAEFFFRNSPVFKGQTIPVFDWKREAYLARYYGNANYRISKASSDEGNEEQKFFYVKTNGLENDVDTIMSQAFGQEPPKNLLLHVVHEKSQSSMNRILQVGEIHFLMMKYFAHVHSRLDPATGAVEFLGFLPYRHSGIEMLPMSFEDRLAEHERQEEEHLQIVLEQYVTSKFMAFSAEEHLNQAT